MSHASLLPRTADILGLLLEGDNITSPQSKQKLVQSVAEFNREMANAKENARTMPGGELLIEEQDEIIEMLEKLKKHKMKVLSKFAQDIAESPQVPVVSAKVEIDSTASTPAN